MDSIFKFKEFSLNQNKVAMKIGTDAVLLGAWCALEDSFDTILDIGSGTGVIALMLAQRSFANTIDAVEKNDKAYEQTVENFENSDWGDRLFCYHTDFQNFANEIYEEEETYDLIVSNPPFYTDDFETENLDRNEARFTSALSFNDLIEGVSKILSKDGRFATIIPFKEEASFINLAKSHQLYISRICNVQGNQSSEIKRSLLEFTFKEQQVNKAHLIIEKERHQYTEDYIALTKDFYLKM